jgi:hypothetical protein
MVMKLPSFFIQPVCRITGRVYIVFSEDLADFALPLCRPAHLQDNRQGVECWVAHKMWCESRAALRLKLAAYVSSLFNSPARLQEHRPGKM